MADWCCQKTIKPEAFFFAKLPYNAKSALRELAPEAGLGA